MSDLPTALSNQQFNKEPSCPQARRLRPTRNRNLRAPSWRDLNEGLCLPPGRHDVRGVDDVSQCLPISSSYRNQMIRNALRYPSDTLPGSIVSDAPTAMAVAPHV